MSCGLVYILFIPIAEACTKSLQFAMLFFAHILCAHFLQQPTSATHNRQIQSIPTTYLAYPI